MSDNDSGGTAPNINTLQRIFGMLPSYAKALREKTLGKPRTSVSMAEPSARICTVCGVAHEHKVMVAEQSTFCMNCERCQKLLEEGYTAVRSQDNRFAFVRGKDLDPGTVITVTSETMDRVKEKFNAGHI